MAIKILKNGSGHDSYQVDRVIRDLDQLAEQGLRGLTLLIDLKRIATNHPRAQRIHADDIGSLVEANLLKRGSMISPLVADVVISATTGEGASLVYTGKPYRDESTPAERAGVAPNDPLGAAANLFAKLRGKDFG
jgi:hypothetical protein